MASKERDEQLGLHLNREHSELIERVAVVISSGCTQHLATTTIRNADASHHAQLACAGGALHHGIAPDATWARLDLILDLLFTELHAPLPSLVRPASPSSEIGDRAGSGKLQATLKGFSGRDASF